MRRSCNALFVLLYAFLCCPSQAVGGEPATLEPLVVTATREKALQSDVAANISVITAEEIANLPVSTVAEALQYVPGMYVDSQFGVGWNLTARIQGSEPRHVAVYKDGVPMNLLVNPVADLSRISVQNIERIEIYKGAASSAWGSALGGVINIITKNPEASRPFTAEAMASYGDYDTWKAGASASGVVDRFDYLISSDHNQSRGFVPNSEYSWQSVYAKAGYRVGDAGRLGLTLNFDENDTAMPYAGLPWWLNFRSQHAYQVVSYEADPTDTMSIALESRHQYVTGKSDMVFSNQRAPYSNATGNEELWGAGMRMGWSAVSNNRLNLGFDGNWGRYDWDSLNRSYHADNWALYANDTLALGRFTFNTGVRLDENGDFGSQISPSAGAVCRFSKHDALIRFQASRGFSAPPANLLNDPYIGNPDLQPEIATSYQLGAEMRPVKGLHLEAGLFRAEVQDLLRFNYDLYQFENIDKVLRQGAEASAALTIAETWLFRVGAGYVDVRNDTTDEVIKDIPQTHISFSATYAGSRLAHTLSGKYMDYNSSYPETEDQVFVFDYQFKAELPGTPGYGRFELFAAIHNLTNTSYIYWKEFPQPGRWLEAGLRFIY